MKMKKFAAILGFLFLSIAIVSAQTPPCPANYASALDQTQAVCDATGRNQACYGNSTINLTPFSQADDVVFDLPGDMTDVEIIRSLSLSALDEETGDWGISMMRLLANLDPNQTEDITMLLFGDVEIESAVEPSITQSATTTTYANIRRFPNTTAPVVNSVVAQTSLTVVGRLEDNSWVHISMPDSNITGWVYAELLNDFEIENLLVVESIQPYFAPMQAFYYRSGNELDCASVPSDGLLIQTPIGVGRVTVWVNEVTIDFMSNTGSTALILTPSDETMSIELLEGAASIQSNQGGYVAVAGSVTTVDLPNANSNSPKVNLPKPSDRSTNGESPANVFDRPVELPDPALVETIANANNLSPEQYDEVETYGHVITSNDPQTNNDTPLSNETDEADSQSQSSNSDCSGNSCNAPGHNKYKDCPGNSCHGNNGNGNGNNGNGNGKNGNGNGNNGNGNGNNGNGNGNNGNGNGNGKK
jgi:hypothetical protein